MGGQRGDIDGVYPIPTLLHKFKQSIRGFNFFVQSADLCCLCKDTALHGLKSHEDGGEGAGTYTALPCHHWNKFAKRWVAMRPLPPPLFFFLFQLY